MKTFWRIEALADGDKAGAKAPAHIHIFDVIGQDFWTGEGVTAKQFVQDLAAVAGRDLVLHLNCAGGDMFEGLAILAALDAHQGQKTVVVESLAASMASVLAMAADKGRIQMAQNAYLMIHNPRGAVRGQAQDLERMAGLMRSLRAKMVATYRRHSTLTEEQLGAAMDAETWYDAAQAKEAGLASEIVGEMKVAAQLDGGALSGAAVPEPLRALFAQPPEDVAAKAIAEAKAAVEASAQMVAELQAKLVQVESEGKAAVEVAQAAGAKAVAELQAANATAVAELQARLAAAQGETGTLSAKLATLTGGMLAPVHSATGGAPAAPRTFAMAIAAIQNEHPGWEPRACWVEAKRLHPQLHEAAKSGK